MTLEEAKTILRSCKGRVWESDRKDCILMDGNFTLQELKAIVVVIESLGIDFQL